MKILRSIGFNPAQWFGFAIFALAMFLLAGCGGGSSGGDNNPPASGGGGEGGDLTITVLDDPLTEQPLSGAFVSLYNMDKQTIRQTVETGNDGVASFGNITTSTVSVSVAVIDNGQGFSEIRTVYDFNPGDYSIFMKDTGCESQATINATYSGFIGAPLAATLDPHITGDGALLLQHSTLVNDASAVFNGVSVCLDDVQTDGKLTHYAFGLDGTGKIISYGFETDQTVTPGASYTSTASLTPTNLNWSAATVDDNPDVVALQAERKGVFYSNLGFWPRPGEAGGEASGLFPAADQFPADAFMVVGTQNLGADNGKTTVRRYDTYQQNVTVDFTENEFTGFTYDPSIENFAWTLIGNSGKDFLQVSTVFGATKWSLNMAPTATAVTLPDLPATVDAWFNRENLNAGETKIMAGDVLATDGYANYNALAAAVADSAVGVNVDFDLVSRQLGDVGNGNGNGGNALFGTLTFTGDGLVSLPSANYEPTSAAALQIIAWSDDIVVVSVQPFTAPLDATKAASVSLGLRDGSITSSWVGSLMSLGGIPGVSVSPSSVAFDNVVLTNQVLGTSITLNGMLTY